MDNQRLLVWGGFALILWLTYQAWMHDYGPPPPTPTGTPAIPGEAQQAADDLALPELGDDVTADPAGSLPGDPPVAEPEPERSIRVVTDVVDIRISTRGATLIEATMLG